MDPREEPPLLVEELEYWKNPSPVPIYPDEEYHAQRQEVLDYSTLSNDNINNLIRARKDSIEAKNVNILMLKALPETEKSGKLLNNLEDAVLKLRHKVRSLENTLKSRDFSKLAYKNVFELPSIVDEEETTLDLKVIGKVLGGHFSTECKLSFKQQFLSLVSYSKSSPLTEAQVIQILRCFLKREQLHFFDNLDPSLPLKQKLTKLLTVYCHRNTIADTLLALKHFQRHSQEDLDSSILRLENILNTSQHLVQEEFRKARFEYLVSSAIISLSLPQAKNRLERFKRDALQSGSFISSKMLLKKAL